MSKKECSKLFQGIRWTFVALGIICFIAGAVNVMSTSKYKKINARDKNAYITNIDTKENPPAVYIAFDYSEDRSIIGRLPAAQYNEAMNECDWVTIYYDVDNPRTITLKNPYLKAEIFLGTGILFLILAFVVVFAFYKKPAEVEEPVN